MLKLVPKEKPTKRVRSCYESLVRECLGLVESGRARSVSEGAWLTVQNHPGEPLNILTLENYARMARRFHVEVPKGATA